MTNIDISARADQAGARIAAGLERAGKVAKRTTDLATRAIDHVEALVKDVQIDARKVAREAAGLHQATVRGWIELQLAAVAAAARKLARSVSERGGHDRAA